VGFEPSLETAAFESRSPHDPFTNLLTKVADLQEF
jgi:hypothetical protein